MGRMVRLGNQEFELKSVILGKETGARFPCCGVGARLDATAARQQATCPECGFPWSVRRKGKGVDWRPHNSRIRRGALPGVSLKALKTLMPQIVAEAARKAKQVRRLGTRG